MLFTQASRNDITNIGHLKGLSFAAVKKDSLGGFMAAYGELSKQGIDPYRHFTKVEFTGMPHDKVVHRVKDKQADIGVVRTGVLEQLNEEGAIDLSEFKILNKKTNNRFPYIHSTDLYPEWPFSKLAHTDDLLARKVVIALLQQPSDKNTEGVTRQYEWAVPLNYQPVHALLKSLRLPPYDQPAQFGILDIADKYLKQLIFLTVSIFLFVLSALLKILKMNKSLTESNQLHKQTKAILYKEKERAEVTLHSIGDAVITVDQLNIVDFINPVAERLTGWTAEEAQGQSIDTIFDVRDENNQKPVFESSDRYIQRGQIGSDDNFTLISRSGKEYAIQKSSSPIRDQKNQILGNVFVFTDITESRDFARKLSYQAAHDPLTALINRREFETRLSRVIENAQTENQHHALCYVDLDQFKVVNDLCGHAAGDKLLCEIAKLMTEHTRNRDTVARLGGDEFGILMEHCTLGQASRVINSIREAVENMTFVWAEQTFNVGLSAGLVPISKDTGSIAELLINADKACYGAKEKGRNCIHLYSEEDEDLNIRHGEMKWVSEIQRALRENLFRLYLQPIVPINQHATNGHFELLVRMEKNKGELILPESFMPAAERYNLARRIDHWVVENIFDWLVSHPEHIQGVFVLFVFLNNIK